MKRTAHLWGVTAPWYDARSVAPPFLGSSKQSAINEAKPNFSDSWPKARREGWYATRITLTWDSP